MNLVMIHTRREREGGSWEGVSDWWDLSMREYPPSGYPSPLWG